MSNSELYFVGRISGADHAGCTDNGSRQFCEAPNREWHDHESLPDNLSSGAALQHSNAHVLLAQSFSV